MASSASKVILFGEHFVVHGSYGIAAAINRHISVEVSDVEIIEKDPKDKKEGNVAMLDIKYNSQQVKETSSLYAAALSIMKHLKINKNLKIEITSEIKGSGLGSSAAFCVAFTRALNEKFDLNLEQYHVNEAAFVGESSFHGTPSGIDNTICCFGGILLFWRVMDQKYSTVSSKNLLPCKGTIHFQEIETTHKIKLIIVDTGKKHETNKMLDKVKEFKENNEDTFKEYIAEVNHLVDDAKDAIIAGNMALLGELMLINHSLLENIGVSTKDIKRIISVGIENGALGGKLTGAGGGGSVILLYDKDELQEKIMAAIKAIGFHCICVEI